MNNNYTYAFKGICSCGGKIQSGTWKTVTEKKSRSTCEGCGRSELVTLPLPTVQTEMTL